MQRKRAIELREAWGDTPCTHPAFAKEYDLGQKTGQHICTQCGKTFTPPEKAAVVASRE